MLKRPLRPSHSHAHFHVGRRRDAAQQPEQIVKYGLLQNGFRRREGQQKHDDEKEKLDRRSEGSGIPDKAARQEIGAQGFDHEHACRFKSAVSHIQEYRKRTPRQIQQYVYVARPYLSGLARNPHQKARQQHCHEQEAVRRQPHRTEIIADRQGEGENEQHRPESRSPRCGIALRGSYRPIIDVGVGGHAVLVTSLRIKPRKLRALSKSPALNAASRKRKPA